MMGKTLKEKEEGARILNNYKKQLAEKLNREKAEKGESLSTTTYSQKTKKSISSKAGGTIGGKSDKKSSRSNKSGKKHP